jgi:hypothetical protein
VGQGSVGKGRKGLVEFSTIFLLGEGKGEMVPAMKKGAESMYNINNIINKRYKRSPF